MPQKPMIEVRGLKKKFGKTEVLKGIDLNVATGEVVAIIGRSGSGKTTMLRCLDGLEEGNAGTIRIGEQTLNCAIPLAKQKKRLQQLRLHTGFVFQNFNLFPHRTALENVMEGLIIVKKMPKVEAETRGMALLERVGLAQRAHAYPAQLSGGQQQRAAIARALAMEPDVILFDEPTSALDPELVGEVLDVIRSLAQEHRTMIIVTHEMNFARDVADRTIFMDEGVVVEQGPSKALFNEPTQSATRHFLRRLHD